jgi:transposase
MTKQNNLQTTKRKRYSPEFKDRAILRAESEGVSQVAKDLGIAESQLYSWRAKQRSSGQSHEIQKQQQAEMSRLKRDLARLKEENDFLKKAAQYFAKEQGQSTK